MNGFEALIGNTLLISAVTGWFVAQVLKTLIHAWVTKSFDPERLVGSGGMLYGVGSPVFAVTSIVAIIVMHDAMGVRLETGKQAKLLNQILDSFKTLEGKKFTEEKLKEFVGHTPLQVLMGAILGILIGWFME